MKFHHINHALTEAEDDPFADPTPTDLKVYLDKLKAQHLRLTRRIKPMHNELKKYNKQIGAVTGEALAVDKCYVPEELHPEWTQIGDYQVSPKVIANSSLLWFIHELKTIELVIATREDIEGSMEEINIIMDEL